jgi:cytochrome oxidase Cu insertion factor (SCO1/SenC/PrrC family)
MQKALRISGAVVLITLIAIALYIFPNIKKQLPFLKIKEGAVKIGEPIDDLTLVSVNGASLRLSDYRGKVLLVNCFASW